MERPPSPPATFDGFVARLLARTTGHDGKVIQTVYDRWSTGHAEGESFLDYLCARGVIDRVGARAVLRTWEGRFDDRDTRELLGRHALGRTLHRLTPAADGPVVVPADARPIGSRLGRYAVKGVLGWGGFGPVYLGVHPTLRVPVALKPAGSADRDRLRVEARLQAAVTHPNVVRVWDYEDGDDPVLVLEYVGGENLRDRLTHGPLAPREAFTLTAQAALALRAAWRAGVTHGDVKPANVLLTPEDGFKLGDFGLARCRRKFARSVAADVPRPGPTAAGTLNYMAPEQFEAAHDHRSDVYSLGLTLHHALTGCVPVPGTDPDEVMLRHKRGDVEPVHRVAPGVRREVSDLVRRMTAVDPARRFDTHDDLIRAAEAAFGMRLDLY